MPSRSSASERAPQPAPQPQLHAAGGHRNRLLAQAERRELLDRQRAGASAPARAAISFTVAADGASNRFVASLRYATLGSEPGPAGAAASAPAAPAERTATRKQLVSILIALPFVAHRTVRSSQHSPTPQRPPHRRQVRHSLPLPQHRSAFAHHGDQRQHDSRFGTRSACVLGIGIPDRPHHPALPPQERRKVSEPRQESNRQTNDDACQSTDRDGRWDPSPSRAARRSLPAEQEPQKEPGDETNCGRDSWKSHRSSTKYQPGHYARKPESHQEQNEVSHQKSTPRSNRFINCFMKNRVQRCPSPCRARSRDHRYLSTSLGPHSRSPSD